MAFKLDQSPSYRWPVEVSMLDENGSQVQHNFQVDFKRLSQTELEKVVEDFRSEDLGSKLTDRSFCEKYVVGWDQVQSADGTPLAFSGSALASLLDVVRVATEIVLAWFESIKVGQEKNSNRQPEPGPMPPVAQR